MIQVIEAAETFCVLKRSLHIGALVLCALFSIHLTDAQAHPHVWVSVKSAIVYAPDGKVSAIQQIWTFDESYSSFLSQGLDTNNDGKLSRDELSELAKVNVESLAEWEYFTSAKSAGKPVLLGQPVDYWLVGDLSKLTLHFTIPLPKPADSRTFALETYDKTFLVAFSLADGDDAVTLVSAPPGCKLTAQRPKAAIPTQTLSESLFSALAQSNDFGAQFANRTIVACP